MVGLTSFINDGNLSREFLAAAGFRVIARRAIRLDATRAALQL